MTIGFKGPFVDNDKFLDVAWNTFNAHDGSMMYSVPIFVKTQVLLGGLRDP